MATLTSSKAAAGVTRRELLNGGVNAVTATYTVSSNPTAGDIIQMVKVPRGATVLDVTLTATDMDTNGTPTVAYTVGDTGDADRFITTSTVGQTGGVARMNAATGANYRYTSDTTIDITVGTASATFAAGTLTLTVLLAQDALV